MFGKVAYVYYSELKNYEQAFYYYNLHNNYSYCILCLEITNNYKKLYSYINKNYLKIGKVQYIHLYNTYFNYFFENEFKSKNCEDYPDLNEKKISEFFTTFFSRYDKFENKDIEKEKIEISIRLKNNLNLFNPSERITSIIKAYIFKKEKYILREIIEQIPINLFFNYFSKENNFFSSDIIESTNEERDLLLSLFPKIEIIETYNSNKLSNIISLGLEKINVKDIFKRKKINYMICLLNRLYLNQVK